ncbi:MAG: hypothetical protein ACEY3L_05505 [Wolbachia sp.]
MLADEIPRRYDGSRWHDDNLVIPLLVSGIYAKIPRMNRGMTMNESRYDGLRRNDDNLVIPLRVSGIC